MILTSLAIAATMVAEPLRTCDGPLDGSWIVAWEEVDDTNFHTFVGLISETRQEGVPATDLVFAVTESVSGLRSHVINAAQSCSQTLTTGRIDLTCRVETAKGGAYNPDRMQITCEGEDLAAATLLAESGEVVLDGLRLHRVMPAVRAPLLARPVP